MEKSSNTNALISEEIVGSVLNHVPPKEAENVHSTKKLSPPSLCGDKIDNCSFPGNIKQEHEDQTTAALLENIFTSSSTIKIKSDLDHHKIEYIPSTNSICEENKSGPQFVLLERPKVIKTEIFSNNIDGLKGSNDCFSKQSEALAKTENSEINSEIEELPKVFCVDLEIKNEKVDLKEEEKEISMLSGHYKRENKKYKCRECNYESKGKNYLKRHLLKHKLKEVKLFRCNKCEFVSHYKGTLKRHILSHTNVEVNIFKCDECEYRARYQSVLDRHQLSHKKIEEVSLFLCNKCDYQTRFQTNLKRHFVKHKIPEEVELFRCDQCDYVTRYRTVIKMHILKHKNPEEVDIFGCDKCDYHTRYKNSLKSHALRHKNPGELDYLRCDKCDYMTRYKSSLKRHALKHKEP